MTHRDRGRLENRREFTMLDQRIDYYPTHTYNGFKLRANRFFGASLMPNGIFFHLFLPRHVVHAGAV